MATTGKPSITVVTASNTNPKYMDCVPMFIEFWQLQNISEDFLVTPLVFLIGDEIPNTLNNYKAFIVLVTPKNLNSAFVAQNIRTLAACIQTTEYVMTTDIDMFPMSDKVISMAFSILNGDNSKFIVCRDVLPKGQFPICYSVASPSTWAQVFPETTNIYQVLDRLRSLMEETIRNEGYSGEHGGAGWFSDQEYLYRQVIANLPPAKLVLLRDEQTEHRRLDRLHLRGVLKWAVIPMILAGRYSDYHVHLPVSKNVRYLAVLRQIQVIRKKLKS